MKNLSKTLLFGEVQFSRPEKVKVRAKMKVKMKVKMQCFCEKREKLTQDVKHQAEEEGDDGGWGSTEERSKGSQQV